MRKAVGSTVLVGLVLYLFAKGALVMRPRETVAALSALIAALVNACSGAADTIPSPQNGAALEECRQGDLVRHGQGHEGRERHVDPAVLDDAQVLGVEPGQLGGLLLGQLTLFTQLPKPKAETALGALDRLLERGSEPDL